jgi:hypothetical protein
MTHDQRDKIRLMLLDALPDIVDVTCEVTYEDGKEKRLVERRIILRCAPGTAPEK